MKRGEKERQRHRDRGSILALLFSVNGLGMRRMVAGDGKGGRALNDIGCWNYYKEIAFYPD